MKLLLALFLAIGSAQASEYECNYEGSQREMNECAIRDYKAAEDALDRAYTKAARVPNSELVAEQQRWHKRMLARCAAQKDEGGTNGTIDYLTCLQTYTELRTLQLLQH